MLIREHMYSSLGIEMVDVYSLTTTACRAEKMIGQMGTGLWVSKKGRGWRRGMEKRVGEVGTKELEGSWGFACVAAATQATRAAAANTREVGTKELGGGGGGKVGEVGTACRAEKDDRTNGYGLQVKSS